MIPKISDKSELIFCSINPNCDTEAMGDFWDARWQQT